MSITSEKRYVGPVRTKAEVRQLIRRFMSYRIEPETAFDLSGWRICCTCKESKPPEDYTTNRNKLDGKDARCNRCKTRIARERYNSKKEKRND